MKRFEPAQVATLIANIGVIAGIMLLVYELRQNNELMEAEARLNRANMTVESWRFTAENGELAELREREWLGEELRPADVLRIDALVMSVFVAMEWSFNELPGETIVLNEMREIQRFNFENRPEFRRVWDRRKASLDPAFVSWMEENVVNQ